MKKLFFTTIIAFVAFALNAQVKVYSGGSTVVGSTTLTATGGTILTVTGGNTSLASSVGIGFTATPSILLDVRSSSTSTAGFMGVANSDASKFITLYNGAVASDNQAIIWPSNGQALRFGTASYTGISWSEKVRIQSDGKVGIGTTSPSSLLSVGAGGNSLYTGYFYNSSTSASSAGLVSEVATPTSSYAYGFMGNVTCGGTGTTGIAIGVRGSSYNSTAQGTTSSSAYGVYGQAGNGHQGYNYGVFGSLLGTNNGTAILATIGGGSATISGQYAGWFEGKIRTTNDSPEKPNPGSWSGYSDIRLKKDTASFKDGLAVLRKIRPITYMFNGIGNLPTQKTYIGVSAQQTETVAPYCISKLRLLVKQSESSSFDDIVEQLPADSSGTAHTIVNAKSFNYDALIYVLINSVKQLDSVSTKQKKEIDSLKQQIANCCSSTGQKTTSQNNNGDGKTGTINGGTIGTDAAKLFQNIPNPFNQTTSIKCFIPEQSKAASLMIFDLNGSLKKTILINGKGEVNVTISGRELIAGMYHYSLIIDNNEIDTKKMILTEQ